MLDDEVHPILADYWERAESPVHLRAPLAALRLADDPAILGADGGARELYLGFRNFEFARTDVSVAMLYGRQFGMFRTPVLVGGSPEQIAAWDSKIVSLEMTGATSEAEP